MKSFIIILFLSIFACSLHAQEISMHILLKDGSMRTLNVDSISNLSFTPLSPPEYSVMHIYRFSHYIAGGDQERLTKLIGDVHFARNVKGVESLVSSSFDTFPLVGPRNNPLGFGNPLDSIQFLRYSKNPNLVALPMRFKDPDLVDSEFGDFQSSVWYGDRIYASWPVGFFRIDSSYSSKGDSLFLPFENVLDLAINTTGDRLLTVHSLSTAVSIGLLIERNLKTGEREILDSVGNISSAVYIPGSNNIIYYSYGSYSDSNKTPLDAGYYLLERSNHHRTRLMRFISELGPNETINGFDISPDGSRLLIPSVGSNRLPYSVEFNLSSQILDTLGVSFDTAKRLPLLWLRYSHDGRSILYGNYPTGAFSGGAVSGPAEIGVIDRTTLSKRVLNTEPDTHGPSVSVLPQWSPDDNMIVFGSGAISTEPRGYIAGYQLYILKTLK
jgi:hypothetical protein